MAKNGSGSTILLGAGALALILFLSKRGGATGLSGGVPLADGTMLLPDGRIVNTAGQVLRTLSPTQQMAYRAQLAQRGGLDAQSALKMIKAGMGYAPKVYSFLDKLLSSEPTAGSAAGVSADVLRDRAVMDMATDPQGMESMIDGDPFDAWDAIDDFQASEFVDAEGLPTDFFDLDTEGFADLSSEWAGDWDLSSWGFDDVPDFDLLDVSGGDVVPDIPFSTGSDATAAGFEAAESAATGASAPAASAADASAAITDSISAATVIGAAAVAVSVAFTIAGDLPDDQKAIMVALDVIIFALAFIPVFGWALAIVGALVKSMVGNAMKPRLSHAQREAREVAQVLGAVAPLPRAIAQSLSPSMLWGIVTQFSSGSFGGTQPDVAVMVSYLSPRTGLRVYVGEPQGGQFPNLSLGWAQDLIDADPLSIDVKIQAGVTPNKIDTANAKITEGLGKTIARIRGAQVGDTTLTRVCVHVWHLYRPLVIDVPAAIEPSIDLEVPILAEALRSLYYQDVARLFGFTRWTELMGFVLQSRWNDYRTQHAEARWLDFQSSLGASDVRQLRQWCFEGRFGAGTEDPAMFTLVFNKLADLQQEISYLAARAVRDAPILERERMALAQQGVAVSTFPPAITIDDATDLRTTLEDTDRSVQTPLAITSYGGMGSGISL